MYNIIKKKRQFSTVSNFDKVYKLIKHWFESESRYFITGKINQSNKEIIGTDQEQDTS